MGEPIVDPFGVVWTYDTERPPLYTATFATGQVWSFRDVICRGDAPAELFQEM